MALPINGLGLGLGGGCRREISTGKALSVATVAIPVAASVTFHKLRRHPVILSSSSKWRHACTPCSITESFVLGMQSNEDNENKNDHAEDVDNLLRRIDSLNERDACMACQIKKKLVREVFPGFDDVIDGLPCDSLTLYDLYYLSVLYNSFVTSGTKHTADPLNRLKMRSHLGKSLSRYYFDGKITKMLVSLTQRSDIV
jgi:hypothetical protein